MLKVIDRLMTHYTWGPRGDRVKMGFASNRATVFYLFLNTFLPTLGVHLIQKCHAIRAFAIIFLSNFGGASYTQVRLIHRRIRYCVGWDAVLGGYFYPKHY